MTTHQQIGRSAVTGSFWTALAFGVNKIVALASAVVLARLLEPSEYGLAAVALLVAAFAELLGEGGLGSAVVYVAGDEKVVRTCLTLAVLTGTMTTLLGIATAPIVADAFHEADVTPLLVVLSSVYVMSSVRHVYAGALARQLQFKKRVLPDTVRALVKAAVTIGLAAAGVGAWALVWGQIAATAADLVAFVVVTHGRLRPGRVDRDAARAIGRYGSRLVVVGVIGVVLQNVDYVAVGARAGSEDLGIYSIAFKVPELTLLALPYITGQALFPIFVRLDNAADDGSAVLRGVLGAGRAIAALAVPMAVVLAVFAPEIVEGVFGDRWTAAGPVLRALALYGLLFALSFTLGDAIKARGRAGVLARLGVARLAVTIPVLWWAAGRGIEWVAWAQVVLAGLLLVATALIAVSVLRLGLGALARAYTVPALAGAAMVVVGVTLRSLLASWPPLVAVTAGGVGSLGTYVLVTWWADPAWTRSLARLRQSRGAESVP